MRNISEFDVFRSERDLAPYAVRSFENGGRRRINEPSHTFRSPFQRDRDRVIHSRAFRRLDGKTQVFLSGSGDHFRTRLTHTIEVEALARTVARRLGVNEDLTETIALAHDLGHTPFGHQGENVLDRLLREHAGTGFEHNQQALRVVDELEEKYPGFEGLNLCLEVRRGLVKHRGEGECRLDDEILPAQPGIEAQIADLADDLAYYGHDVDDGLDAGLLKDQELLTNVRLWRLARDCALKNGERISQPRIIAYTVRCLIDNLAGDAILNSMRNLQQAAPQSAEEVKRADGRMVDFSAEIKPLTKELRDFLFTNLYKHSEIARINARMGKVVEDLFHYFLSHPESLGRRSRRRVGQFSPALAVADYIAGMTDSFALQVHKQYCGGG